ncbi:MAG: nucleotide exchange factor GrpE [Senegalimassilia anaerobia]|uniref:nucleotide exchange factor GrpE n=1 Tax=Senegalimassilia anaerobia TaxID=1473216 RepID=UPI002E79DD15|nr:nucleotide exchange factor GrpE [Senegalimassilia anaerobia]MEE0225820.1 nucleotide exchange factor GrpE [Senegalimassilia anaerobia]MEE0304185.1 nucleotide exchange factor GrpE [Senegalimassilia anaerobia]
MTMQSTPEPERATQDQGTQIPIQDEASDVKQESAAQQGGAAPEADSAASDAVAEAEEVLEAQAEEAPTNDELVEKAQAEAKDWQDKYLRLHAEWDTYRRRTAEQREQERLRAGEKLVEKLLPVIDDFERTIDYAEKNGEAGLIDGVKAVHSKFVNVLETGGVQVINPAGQAFDALECQAVATVDDASVPDETVHEVYQKGYKMGTKVLRAAMVTVTTGGPKRPKPESEDE